MAFANLKKENEKLRAKLHLLCQEAEPRDEGNFSEMKANPKNKHHSL